MLKLCNKRLQSVVFSAVSSMLLSVSLFFSVISYADEHVLLSGEIKQGGLIVGKAPLAKSVTLNGQSLSLSSEGDFVFGFSRDDKKTYQLVTTLSSGKEVVRELTPEQRKYNIQRIKGIKKSIMQPNPNAVARSAKDRKQVKQARTIESDLTYFAHGFIAPIKGKITGIYGSQRFYNGVPKSPHYGLDFAQKKGFPVKAPAAGTVLLWEPDMFYSGGTLIIDHGHGVTSTFLHLSASSVKAGDSVKQGQVVAAVGKSGRATGYHLDWRINWFNVRIDPALVLKVKQINL